jgi:hypothetical protein
MTLVTIARGAKKDTGRACELSVLALSQHTPIVTTDQPPPMMPMLIYSWGSTFHLFLVSGLKMLEKFTNQCMGELMTVEVGRLVFEEKEQRRRGITCMPYEVTCACSAAFEARDPR